MTASDDPALARWRSPGTTHATCEAFAHWLASRAGFPQLITVSAYLSTRVLEQPLDALARARARGVAVQLASTPSAVVATNCL